MKGEVSKWLKLYPVVVILLSCVLSFSVRLFSIINYESIIHEFDPWFNYRSTLELINKGFYEFINWFDDKAWYPLGRIVGGTVYPGLMVTSGFIFHLLNFFTITVDIRNVCVLLAPLFSCFTLIISFMLTKELWNIQAGLICAVLMAIVPGYISRSTAGSYDNEGIAIFAMLLTFYLWIKSLKTGNVFWSILCSFAYFYMVSAWGGYVYIINLISLHVIVLILFQRYSSNLYISFSIFYIFGLLFSMQIPFVGFQSLKTNEHMSATCAFLVIQIYHFLLKFQKINIIKSLWKYFYLSITLFGICTATIYYLTKVGILSPWSGRFYSLLDTSYAAINIPIITSVSEHQPTMWHSTFYDLSILMCFYPSGIWLCFKHLNDERIFLILYAITASYFSGIMIRLILALTPIVCISSSISFNSLLNYIVENHKYTHEEEEFKLLETIPTNISEEVDVDCMGDNQESISNTNKKITKQTSTIYNYFTGIICSIFLIYFALHSIHVISASYSSPSIIMSSTLPNGETYIIDDFREAYHWLRLNTKEDSRIMSWWDYGYQITGLANRTTIVDNNTWNNSHIALVGKAMSSNESKAIEIIRQLDVDYILVIFGGVIGFSGDDINKFLWMVRISEGEHPKDIFEYDYFTKNGEYRVDNLAPKALLDSLLYRLSYYRFGEIRVSYKFPFGYDATRHCEIGLKNFKLQYFEESFTSENWMVRIYKTKKVINRPLLLRLRKKSRELYSQKSMRNLKGVFNNERKIIKGVKRRYYSF